MPEAQTMEALAPGRIRQAGLLGVGAALPDSVVQTAELAARFGVDEEWLISRTGIRSRRIAEPDARLSDLAAEAGRRALEHAEVSAEQVDLVVVATLTADEMTPNAAPLVAHALGASRAGAFDVGAACTAFVSALACATAMIEAGRADVALVVGADVLSRVTNRDDRTTAALFADGAGAVVLGAGDGYIGPISLGHDGSGASAIVARRGGYIEMDGHETFRHAVNRLTAVTEDVVGRAGLGLDDVDVFVFHQANARITRAVGNRLGLDPQRVVDCIADQGNTSAATIPLALAVAERDGRLAPGSILALAAFGAGFTWGGAVLRWGQA